MVVLVNVSMTVTTYINSGVEISSIIICTLIFSEITIQQLVVAECVAGMNLKPEKWKISQKATATILQSQNPSS